MKKLFIDKKKGPWFWAFITIAVILFFIVPIMSLDAGNSGDEDGFQIPYAEQVYNFYATGGQDTTCLTNDDMGMHGGFFDPLTVAIVKAFDINDYATTRHLMNSFFGYLGMLFTALLAYRLSNWRAGVVTFILIFLSPRYLGHSFNNPKDLIFSATMMGSLYYAFRLVMEYPKPKIYTSVMLTIFTALAIVSRFAGYLVFAYIILFLSVYHFIVNRKNCLQKDAWNTVVRYFIYVAVTAVVTFLLAIAMWPYIMNTPVKTTIKIVTEMSNFAVSLRQLFEGSLIWSDMLPWYYTPKYILTTIPIAVIAGVILFFIFCWRKKEDRFWAFFVFFTFFFPVFWIVFTRANVYGGWRHAMFAYPPMVVAAGWGIDELVKWIEKKLKINNEESIVNNDVDDSGANMHIGSTKGIIVNIAALAVLLATLIGPIRHIIANHPYEYVYFNAFVGGMDGAYGQYEMDYYYHSTREASEWVIANAPQKADGSKTIVATWHSSSVGYFFRNDTARFTPRFCRWHEKGNSDWDYAIFTVTGMQPEQITNAAAFPPPDCVHTIDVDGKPICIILKRESKNDLLGSQYKAKGNIDSAIICLKQALAINPYNEAAINNLIECYFMTGKQDSAKLYIDHELTFLPKDNSANYYLLHYYLSKGDVEQAKKTCKFMIECNPKFTGAYSILSDIYLRTNDINNAKKTLTHLIDIDQLDNQCMQKLINIYKAEGFDDRGAYRKMYKTIYESLEKRGKKKEAEVYKDLYQQLK